MTWSDYMREHGKEEYAAWEAATKPLTDRIADLERQNQRLTDLVRYARHHLFNEEAISPEEYAALVMDSEKGQRVARLEDYDGMRQHIKALERDLRKLAMQLAEAREDTARLGWLAEKTSVRKVYLEGVGWVELTREEIDAARGAR